MNDKPKTAAERAEEYTEGIAKTEGRYAVYNATEDFLAGRADFIENDLPRLLEMARDESKYSEIHNTEWEHTIEEILEEARKL